MGQNVKKNHAVIERVDGVFLDVGQHEAHGQGETGVFVVGHGEHFRCDVDGVDVAEGAYCFCEQGQEGACACSDVEHSVAAVNFCEVDDMLQLGVVGAVGALVVAGCYGVEEFSG